MTHSSITPAAIAGLAFALAPLSGSAAAQEVYVGAALDYGNPHSGAAQSSGTLLAGVAFGAGPLTFGAELDYGTPVGGDQTRDILHARALGRYDVGGLAVLASLGATQYDVAGDRSYSGFNLGLGVEYPVSGRITLRGEVIRDFMDDGYPADVTTARIGVLYSF